MLEEGRERDPLRPFGAPRALGVLLYAVFGFLLLIPLVRRWRRQPWWNAARVCVLVAAAGPLVWWALEGDRPATGWLLCAATALLALLCGPAVDPDRERKLQRRHRADYLLNGGELISGRLPDSASPRPGPLYLLIRGDHLLLVPKRGPGEVHSAFDIRRIRGIRVGGETYVPIYVSEAKDPPVKETAVDRGATLDLDLDLEDGNLLSFRYRGPFRKHLAETAAHAIHSVRERLARPQPAELAQRI